MGNGLDIAHKVFTLKKSGISLAVIVLVTLLSTPGFYEAFFDDKEEQTQATVEVAYEVLKARVDEESRSVAELRSEIREIRGLIHNMLLTGRSPASSANALSGKSKGVDCADEPECVADAAMMSDLEDFMKLNGEEDSPKAAKPMVQQRKSLPELDSPGMISRIRKKASKR